MVIIAECLLGVFMAMTNGVDQSFIKFNVNKIDDKGDLLKIVNARINTFRYIAMLLVVLIGGFIAKYNLRLTVFLSGKSPVCSSSCSHVKNEDEDVVENDVKHTHQGIQQAGYFDVSAASEAAGCQGVDFEDGKSQGYDGEIF